MEGQPHPYAPIDLKLPGYAPNFLTQSTIAMSPISGWHRKLAKIDRLLMCWRAFTGKEYSKGDSRYAARDAATVTVEGVAAFVEGPASLLAVYAIASGKSYSYILHFAVSLGQLYGAAVYFLTAYLEGDHFAATSYHYYVYYIGANASWAVIPSLIAIRCWNKICSAQSKFMARKGPKVTELDLCQKEASFHVVLKEIATARDHNSSVKKKAKHTMDSISLELKVISCRDLKAFNFFQKLSVYVAVSIFIDEPRKNEKQRQKTAVDFLSRLLKKNEKQLQRLQRKKTRLNDEEQKNEQQKLLQRQETPVDRGGGSNPEWNHMMQFDLNTASLPGHGDHHLFFKFELRCEGAIFGNKAIGEVRVPFKDLIEGFNGSVRIVNYHVRNSDRESIGVLSFSYELCYPVKPHYTMPPPTFPLQLSPPVAVDHGVYQHEYPSPLIQAPASYRYMKKTPEWLVIETYILVNFEIKFSGYKIGKIQAAQVVRPELIKHEYKVTDSNRENLAI
ncbi:hypothetical protein SADUNF_Sadunf01G0051400 [Salix dunnii]|uniref:C2 domain-containing protein n=1 Tax=Salix dunnii TaxID=1413687 RepID=A0A835NA55_9ROSI|nr:hypothetical protein SADUNF_Sadunf01G0051400 [Salix dunnii]